MDRTAGGVNGEEVGQLREVLEMQKALLASAMQRNTELEKDNKELEKDKRKLVRELTTTQKGMHHSLAARGREVQELQRAFAAVTEPMFFASKEFAGGKNGYAFKKGPKGVGYYFDQVRSR